MARVATGASGTRIALIIKDEQRVELRSRKNKDLTGMYPGIAAAGQRLKADQAVVDGEIVALDAQGKLALSRWGRSGSPTAAVTIASSGKSRVAGLADRAANGNSGRRICGPGIGGRAYF